MYGGGKLSSSGKIFLTASSCGFCRGVRNALEQFEKALADHGTPVYVLHELVHNNFVTGSMAARGAVFVSSLSDVPDNSTLLIGAHGVPEKVMLEAKQRFNVIDATCPRVLALQKMAGGIPAAGELVMLCKPGHPEAEGVMGHSSTGKIYPVSSVEDAQKLPDLVSPVLLSQTTVSGKLVEQVTEYLRSRFPGIRTSSRICDASSRRQQSVDALAKRCDCIIVVGSKHSSNAYELYKLAQACGVKSYFVDSPENVTDAMLAGHSAIGITAGASTPDELIDGLKERLKEFGFSDAGVAE